MNTRNRFAPGKAPRPGVLAPAMVLIAAAIAMAGCSYNVGGGADTRPSSPGSSAGHPAAPPTATSTSTPIVIELQGQRIAGALNGSAASASLLARLPLTLAFRDHGGQEKLAHLPVPLDLEGAPAGSDAAPLMIGYYVPDQSLVLYYRDVDYFHGIVPLGTYEHTDAIKNQPDGFTATLRKAE